MGEGCLLRHLNSPDTSAGSEVENPRGDVLLYGCAMQLLAAACHEEDFMVDIESVLLLLHTRSVS